MFVGAVHRSGILRIEPSPALVVGITPFHFSIACLRSIRSVRVDCCSRCASAAFIKS